jgi:hypothetical protein
MSSSVANRCRRRVFDGVMTYSLQIESRPIRLVSHINAVWRSQESARDRLLLAQNGRSLNERYGRIAHGAKRKVRQKHRRQ